MWRTQKLADAEDDQEEHWRCRDEQGDPVERPALATQDATHCQYRRYPREQPNPDGAEPADIRQEPTVNRSDEQDRSGDAQDYSDPHGDVGVPARHEIQNDAHHQPHEHGYGHLHESHPPDAPHC